MMLVSIVIAVLVAVAMEPISAGIHRYFGHGIGWPLHRSHHEGEVRGLEANDAIPAFSAVVTIIAFLIGVSVDGANWLVPVAAGATIYGVVYFTLHDLYIHRRVPILPARIGWLEPYRRAHLEHHRTGTGHWGILSR